VAVHTNMLASLVGPALHDAGGSRPRSINSCRCEREGESQQKRLYQDRLRSGDQLDGDVRRNDQSPESGGDDCPGASGPLQLVPWMDSGSKLTLLMRFRAMG
jgi:hypothetical protein